MSPRRRRAAAPAWPEGEDAIPAPRLAMWPVVWSPRDMPGFIVARRWRFWAPGVAEPTAELRVAETLTGLRLLLPLGLERVPISLVDRWYDPQLVETWWGPWSAPPP